MFLQSAQMLDSPSAVQVPGHPAAKRRPPSLGETGKLGRELQVPLDHMELRAEKREAAFPSFLQREFSPCIAVHLF